MPVVRDVVKECEDATGRVLEVGRTLAGLLGFPAAVAAERARGLICFDAISFLGLKLSHLPKAQLEPIASPSLI